MTDDDSCVVVEAPGRIAGIDLDAWDPPPPAVGLADAVVARMQAPVRVSARELVERTGRRWWWLIGGVVAAAAAASVLAVARWGIARTPDNGQGDVFAARATHLELGPSSAELDLGAEVHWRRDGQRIIVAQPRGGVTWRVAGADTLAINDKAGDRTAGATGAAVAPVASIEATGASLRVAVRPETHTIDASAATAVTVVVYAGHVTVTGADQTVSVGPGGTIEVPPGAAPREVLTVGAADREHGLEARVRALEAELAASKQELDDDPSAPAGAPRDGCDEASCALNDEAACCQRFKQDRDVRRPAIGSARLDRAAIDQGIALAIGAVRACADGRFAGKLKASLTVAPTGKVDRVTVAPANASVAGCVTTVLLAARFVPSRAGASFQRAFEFHCDPADLLRRGTTAYATGQFAQALTQFEQALACKADPSTGLRAFMAACRLNDRAKARRYYQLYPTEARQAVSICVRGGITEEDLRLPKDALAPNPARAPVLARCDFADLLTAGNVAYANGSFRQALHQFEAAIKCKWDREAIVRAFMAACRVPDRSKAAYYFHLAPSYARAALTVCANNGILEAELVAATPKTSVDAAARPPTPSTSRSGPSSR